jgi:ABC-type antimicrobial peptide transport system permease subunit
MMFAFFAVAAIGVSAAGLVGVVGFVVARRTREIAIRMAIGASAAEIRRLVTREATLASSCGAVLGLTLGAWLSRTMESLLFGIGPADPVSLAVTTALIVAIGFTAAWVPARRALKLSPSAALRIE